jgi:capsular exopolysaccharide synthesis family protein
MSRFFKALEQADRDRALHGHATWSKRGSEGGLRIEETVSHGTPPRPGESVADRSTGFDEHLVSLLQPTSFEADQYRTLRHLIEQLHKSADLSAVAVSSPGVADGKTTTAINLAGVLAEAPEARVLLIDADLRGAAVMKYLGFAEGRIPSFMDAISDVNFRFESVARVRPSAKLFVLPAGRLPSSPFEMLKSRRVEELFTEARRRYDYIIADTPPIVSVPDCRVVGKLVDGFLIVVTAHRTPRTLLREALTATEPTKIVGLVFNGDDGHLSHDVYSSRRPSVENGNG